MGVQPLRLHLVEIELHLRLAGLPAPLRAQLAARALRVGEHQAQGRDRDELAVPRRLQMRGQHGERQATVRPRGRRQVAQVDIERGRLAGGQAQAALQPRGGRAIGQRAQVQLGGVHQHRAHGQARERGHARAGAGARRRASRAGLALQVGDHVEAFQRTAQGRAGGPMRQRCGAGRRSRGRGRRRRGLGRVVRRQRHVDGHRRVGLRPHAALGQHVFPRETEVVDAVQGAAVGADGQRGLHVAQRWVVGDGQRAHPHARHVQRHRTAQRGGRLGGGARLRGQRRDAHRVGGPRGEGRADPGAGVRVPAQVEAGDGQVVDVHLHAGLERAQRADAQVAAAERAVHVDHREPGHVLEQPARAAFAAPQRPADGHAGNRRQRRRRRGQRGDAADARPSDAAWGHGRRATVVDRLAHVRTPRPRSGRGAAC